MAVKREAVQSHCSFVNIALKNVCVDIVSVVHVHPCVFLSVFAKLSGTCLLVVLKV